MPSGQTFTTVSSIFLLLLAGYIAKRLGALRPSDASVVNALVVNLTMPAFIFVSVHDKPLTPATIKAPGIGILMESVVIVMAYSVARILRLDRRTTGALTLVSAFGNTGFLGYPVVTAAFGNKGDALLCAVMFDEFAMAMILNSVGVTIAIAASGARFEWKNVLEFLKSPLFPATIIALAMRRLAIPGFLMSTLEYLAAGTVPLAMISIGLTLSTGTIRNYPFAILVALILKMIVLPVLVWLSLSVLGIQGVVRQVSVLESAMPSAVFSGVVAARFGANGSFAAAAIFVMTMFSVILIPLTLILIK